MKNKKNQWMNYTFKMKTFAFQGKLRQQKR